MSKIFDKYKKRGDIHWQEAFSRSIFKFNAALAARYRVALEMAGEIKGKVVLDAGAGDCALASLFARAGAQVIAVDNCAEGLDLGRRHFDELGLKAEFLLADIGVVPLVPAVADIVISADVIEHLEEPAIYLKEIKRLLKPGGRLVLTTPYRLREKPHPLHIREFYPGELKTLLLAEGFFDIKIKETHPFLWHALYTTRGPLIKKPLAKYLINLAALWLNKNPFLRDDVNRGKNDFFVQIACRAVKKN